MKRPSNTGTALVTGSAKRLGQAMVLHLARQGYNIALHYHSSKADAMKTAQAIYKTGVRCELFCCDLADETQTQQLIPKVYKAFNDFNLLVNSASTFVPSRLQASDLTLFHAHWNTNFKAPYILSCEFARICKKGQIVNFIDANVTRNKSNYADYLLTKKALLEFTKMAAVQFGPKIRVNGISPGMILSPVNGQDDRKNRAGRIPLQRLGHPRYILETLQFLLSNDYMTGQIIANDGGEQLV